MSEPNPTIKIEGFHAQHLTDAIVEAAARQLLYATSVDDEDHEVSYRNELARRLEGRVNEVIKDFAKEAAEPILRDVLSRPLPQTDRYGDITNDKGGKTVAEAIGDEVRKQITEVHGNYDRRSSILSDLIKKEVDTAVRGALQDEINAARAAIKARMTQKAAELIASETLREAGIR
jgi:hypothetical protein